MSNDRAGSGAESLFGLAIEQPSDRGNVGHFLPDTVPVTPPDTAPTAAVGASGTVTASIEYAYGYVMDGGFLTPPSPYAVAVVLSAHKGALSVIANSADSRVHAKYITRKVNGGAAHILDYIWNNTTTVYVDDFSPAADPPIVDVRIAPPTVNQTGGNYGLKFFAPESADPEANYGTIKPKQLKRTPGPAAGIPGGVILPVPWKDIAFTERLVMETTAMLGAPDITYVANEPTVIYDWYAKNRKRNPRTLAYLNWPGGSLTPEWMFQIMGQEQDISSGEDKAVESSFKGMACHHTKTGIGIPDEGNTGTGAPPVPYGIRQDAKKLTDPVGIEVSTAATAGSMGLKYSTDTVFDGLEHPNAYNTTSKKQTKLAANGTDRVEVFDENGLALGADVGSNLKPFGAILPGDVTLHDAGDKFILPIVQAIPDVYSVANPTGPGDDGSYTGIAPVFMTTPRYTFAHLTYRKGLVSATEVFELESAAIKITGGLKAIKGLGREAAFPRDMEPAGDVMAQLTFTRRYTDRTFEENLESDTKSVGEFRLEGERIPIHPGVVSTYRETYQVSMPQMATVSTKKATSGDGVINETVVQDAEEPTDGSDHLHVRIITRVRVPHPA